MFGFLKNFLARLAPTPVQSRDDPAPLSAPPPSPAGNSAPSHQGNGAHGNGAGIQLPMDAILNGLPLELHPRIRSNGVTDQTLSVPLETILPQLALGRVRIPFGVLRRAAPHLFSTETDRDDVQVTLPLGEILNRLNPAFILRRRSQKHVEVPQEVTSPFDSQARALAIAPSPSITALPPDPLPFTTPPALRRPPGLLSSLQAPARPNSLIPMPSASGPPAVPFILGLGSLAEGWPEGVRRHILELNLAEAKVVLPAQTIEQALRQGRVAFKWKTLRAWITPPPPPAASAEDDTLVELPLQIVAPLFLARQRQTNQPRQKVTIDQSIPNLFFGFLQPESPRGASPPSASPDDNSRVWEEASEAIPAPQKEAKHSPTPGTRFIAKYATPNEIVSAAAALDNVAGALVGLPDGLLVASRLGPDLNADTLAAFLPQIFGKVSQCTKELRMGDLNNLSFMVGDIPWALCRVNAIFFAAFGRPGQPLPASQLAALASELDHKPK